MLKVRERFNRIIMSIITMSIGAVTMGTILYFIWEDSLTAMFPTAIASGVLAAKLTWWQAIKISWVSNILIKIMPETKINKKEAEMTYPESDKKVIL